MDKDQVHQIMMEMPDEWRYRWCGGWACACMGAANCSGNASAKGVTKTDWLEWKVEHPDPDAHEKELRQEALERFIDTLVATKTVLS